MAGKLEQHKVARGETLEGIAKKRGVDWKAVWKAPENKALVAKRGKPEALQPGDVLAIPPSPKATKEAEARVKALAAQQAAALAYQQALLREEARIQQRLKVFDELLVYNRESTEQIVKELDGSLSDTKRWADGVDAAAAVAQIMVAVTSICSKGLKSTKLSGAALEKLNQELAKDALAMPADALKDVGIKQAGNLKSRAGEALGYVGVLADSFDKMTSPSFWANTYVQVTENQKSWSEAVAMDVGDDIRERMKGVRADGDKREQELRAQQARVKAQQAENARMLDECARGLKTLDAEMRALQ